MCVRARMCLNPVTLQRHVSRVNNYQPATKKESFIAVVNQHPTSLFCTSAALSIDGTITCGRGGGIMEESPPLHPHILHANRGGNFFFLIHKHKLSAHIHNFQWVPCIHVLIRFQVGPPGISHPHAMAPASLQFIFLDRQGVSQEKVLTIVKTQPKQENNFLN